MKHGPRAAGGESHQEHWMRMALDLARKGRGITSPNPMVGAVVVTASGQLAGAGWHRGPGKPHAEVLALAEAGPRARRGSVYVNLEPCAHRGMTPPCVDALLASGVQTVICSMVDPDPRVSGKGIRTLRRGGVDVREGLLEEGARELNRAYITHRTQNRPYVSLKMAVSLDGRTSAADGSSRWITGDEARHDVHRLRAWSDAVCAGVGTILLDDPSLSVRGVRRKEQVCRVVVDSLARTPPGARVLQGDGPTLLFASSRAPKSRLRVLEKAGAEVVVLPADSALVPIDRMLEQLAQRSILDLLLEGGPRLAGSFAALALIDRYLIYIAPKLLGSPGSGPVIEGWAARSIGEARPLTFSSVRRLGADLRLEAFPVKGPEKGR